MRDIKKDLLPLCGDDTDVKYLGNWHRNLVIILHLRVF